MDTLYAIIGFVSLILVAAYTGRNAAKRAARAETDAAYQRGIIDAMERARRAEQDARTRNAADPDAHLDEL